MLTAEQLELRRRGIGSSEIPAIAGVSPYASPLDVWLEKMGRSVREDTEQTEIGNELEEPIARMAARRLGATSIAQGTTVVHQTCPWALATPDRHMVIADEPSLLEIKGVGHRLMHHWGADVEDPLAVPEYVRVQVTWQMLVTGAQLAYVAALLGGRDLRVYRVPFDAALGESLLEIGHDFWFDHVIAGVQPPPDGNPATTRWLSRLWKSKADVVIQADQELEDLAAAMRQFRATRTLIDRRVAQVEQMFKLRMADAAVVEGADWKITWKTDRAGRTDWKAVAMALGATPDLIEKHRGEPGRRFLVPRAWGVGDEE